MNKITIALLLLVSLPLHGTKPKKPHRTPSRAQYLTESAQLCAKKIEAHHTREHYLTESAARRAEIRRNNKQQAEQQLLLDQRREKQADVCCTSCKFVIGVCSVAFEGWIRYMGMPNPGSVNATKC